MKPYYEEGMRVIESVYLIEDGEPYEVRRPWRERLFSRPWRPMQATRLVVPKVPYRGAFKLTDKTLVMHPETLRQLRKALPLTPPAEPCGRSIWEERA